MNNIEGATITVPEYFELIQKVELTPKEQYQVQTFENFITNAIQYEDLASDFLKSVIAMYRAHIRALYSAGKEELVEQIESKMVRKLPNNGNVRTHKLPDAGFVSSAIILVVLLNIGFIVALTIIGGR